VLRLQPSSQATVVRILMPFFPPQKSVAHVHGLQRCDSRHGGRHVAESISGQVEVDEPTKKRAVRQSPQQAFRSSSVRLGIVVVGLPAAGPGVPNALQSELCQAAARRDALRQLVRRQLQVGPTPGAAVLAGPAARRAARCLAPG